MGSGSSFEIQNDIYNHIYIIIYIYDISSFFHHLSISFDLDIHLPISSEIQKPQRLWECLEQKHAATHGVPGHFTYPLLALIIFHPLHRGFGCWGMGFRSSAESEEFPRSSGITSWIGATNRKRRSPHWWKPGATQETLVTGSGLGYGYATAELFLDEWIFLSHPDNIDWLMHFHAFSMLSWYIHIQYSTIIVFSR